MKREGKPMFNWLKRFFQKRALNKRLSSYSPEEIQAQRDLWEARKCDIDQRRAGWKKQQAEIDEMVKRIEQEKDNSRKIS